MRTVSVCPRLADIIVNSDLNTQISHSAWRWVCSVPSLADETWLEYVFVSA